MPNLNIPNRASDAGPDTRIQRDERPARMIPMNPFSHGLAESDAAFERWCVEQTARYATLGVDLTLAALRRTE
jgi:hypothetical protein